MADLILIAAGDADLATDLEINLSLEGWDVYVSRDGIDALDQARKLQPSVVIVDAELPVLDGLDVCAELRRDVRTVNSAVILIGAGGGPDKLASFAAGVDDHLVKPVDPPELVARVRSLLRRTSQMRDLSPLTHLPGNFRIASELERLVSHSDSQFAVLYADLNEFKAFNDYYGFLRGDEVIKFTARHPGRGACRSIRVSRASPATSAATTSCCCAIQRWRKWCATKRSSGSIAASGRCTTPKTQPTTSSRSPTGVATSTGTC